MLLVCCSLLPFLSTSSALFQPPQVTFGSPSLVDLYKMLFSGFFRLHLTYRVLTGRDQS